MHEFCDRFRQVRDGSRTPVESWDARAYPSRDEGRIWFIRRLEDLKSEDFEQVLLAAAHTNFRRVNLSARFSCDMDTAYAINMHHIARYLMPLDDSALTLVATGLMPQRWQMVLYLFAEDEVEDPSMAKEIELMARHLELLKRRGVRVSDDVPPAQFN